MGVVYQATDLHGCPAAVKLLLAVEKGETEQLRRFEREARIRIEHPNVRRVLDAGTDADGTPYIAFELLEGESLDARIARSPLSPADAVDVGAQVCRGLAAAHAAGVVHRDLKPSNVFICADGSIKLFDFGIATWWTGQATCLTATGTILGTPAYLSPEQARGLGGVDARSDIWSAGVLLYECLSGRLPFERETALATMLAILMDDPVPLASRVAHVPAALSAVIQRAMQKTKEERWPNAEALEHALLEIDLVAPAALTRPRPPVPSIPPGEQRLVAVLLVEGVRDLCQIEPAVAAAAGLFFPMLGNRAVAVFGCEKWEGDELLRAATVALRCRPAAERMAVLAGHAAAEGPGISGAAVRAAEVACAAGLKGVATDAKTAHMLGNQFAVRDVGEGLWEITDEAVPQASAVPGSASPTVRTVGRHTELAQLRALADRVLRDRCGAAVVVTGPAGIGKSHLRRELEQTLLARAAPEIALFVGQVEPMRRGDAMALIASALRGRAREGAALRAWPSIDPLAPADERRQAVLRLAGEAVGVPNVSPPWAEVLGELLGIEMGDAAFAATGPHSPQVVTDRFRMALRDYFHALCLRGPVAFFAEDLQWADVASVETLADLADHLRDLPFLLFCAARTDWQDAHPSAFEGLEMTQLRLHGLFPSEVAQLAVSAAGRGLPDGLVRAIAERTDGNPYFVQEIVLALTEIDIGEQRLENLPLPLTVEAAVQSRLDHLTAGEKDFCRRAAVFGRPFVLSELTAVGALDSEAIAAKLGRRAILVTRPRGPGGEREYRFRSPLVAEVAYGMLTDDLRAELHRRAATFLARQAGSEDEEVAAHHERGGQLREAAVRYFSAALGASRRGDSRSVVRCAQRGLALGEPRVDIAFDLHVAHADALAFLGRRADQETALESALVRARTEAEKARVLTKRAELMWRTGRLADAIGTAGIALDLARRAGDQEAEGIVRGWQVASFLSSGKVREAHRALRDALALSGTSVLTRAFLAARRAALAGATGDLSERRDAFRTAAGLYREAGDVRTAAVSEANLADTYNRIGAFEDAVTSLELALEESRRVGNRGGEGFVRCNLAYSLSRLGKTAEALAHLDRASAIARLVHDSRLAVATRVYRAQALLSRGDATEALSEAKGAAADAEPLGLSTLRVTALTAAAKAALAVGDGPAADDLSERALDLRNRVGGVEEDDIAVFMARAEVLENCGRPAEAVELRRHAQDELWVAAGRISDPGWRARFLRSVPEHRPLLEEDEA